MHLYWLLRISVLKQGSKHLCWLLSTSVQEIGILHAIEHASLPKHVRCEYNQQRPFCSFSLASCLFSRRRGSIRELCVHFDQATNLFQLSRAPRTFFALDQTIDDFPGDRNACRHDQRKIRPACGKRPVTAPTDHPPSTDQTPRLSEDRSVAPCGSCQDDSDLETSAFPYPTRDPSALAP